MQRTLAIPPTAPPQRRESGRPPLLLQRRVPKIALWCPRTSAAGRAVAASLRDHGFPVARAVSDAAEPLTAYQIVIIIAGENRRQAISLVEELGSSSRRPCVVLVIPGLTAGEYETLVNVGPVRYVFDDTDSTDCIIRGVCAAIRAAS